MEICVLVVGRQGGVKLCTHLISSVFSWRRKYRKHRPNCCRHCSIMSVTPDMTPHKVIYWLWIFSVYELFTYLEKRIRFRWTEQKTHRVISKKHLSKILLGNGCIYLLTTCFTMYSGITSPPSWIASGYQMISPHGIINIPPYTIQGSKPSTNLLFQILLKSSRDSRSLFWLGSSLSTRL